MVFSNISNNCAPVPLILWAPKMNAEITVACGVYG